MAATKEEGTVERTVKSGLDRFKDGLHIADDGKKIEYANGDQWEDEDEDEEEFSKVGDSEEDNSGVEDQFDNEASIDDDDEEEDDKMYGEFDEDQESEEEDIVARPHKRRRTDDVRMERT